MAASSHQYEDHYAMDRNTNEIHVYHSNMDAGKSEAYLQDLYDFSY